MSEEAFSGEELAAWHGFLRTHAIVTKRLDALLRAQHGLALTQFDALIQLRIVGGSVRMSQLAESLLLSRSGVTGIVDGLEGEGLVKRRRDTEDGRVLWVDLTASGSKRLGEVVASHAANVRMNFLDPLTQAQRRALRSSWKAIAERAEAIDG